LTDKEDIEHINTEKNRLNQKPDKKQNID